MSKTETSQSIQSESQPTSHSESVQLVIRPKGAIFGNPDTGKQDWDVGEFYGQMIKTDNSNVIYDAIFTTKRLFLRPSGASAGVVSIAAAIIAPGLAQAVDLVQRRISSLLTAPASSLQGTTVEGSVFEAIPSWNYSGLAEVKESLPTFFNPGGTILKFIDEVAIGTRRKRVSVSVVFDGSATPSKKPFAEFNQIKTLCGIDTSRILKF